MDFLKNLKLNKKKSAFFVSVFLLVFIGVLGYGQNVKAWSITDFFTGDLNLGTVVVLMIGYIIELLVNGVGLLVALVVDAIGKISIYNNFINESSIVMAWGIIRDFCNMFFILILLVIAFATILRIESYNMKKWLPKLLIMAVLINFSRTIVGLIIDFSQVFMMTFVSALNANGSGYINALGVRDYFNLAETNLTGQEGAEKASLISILTGMIVGFIFLLITLIVLLVVLFVLVLRIVMLWIYVVLSPFAFLMAAFPGGQKYSSMWWSEFIKNVITGPILMFFVWLALITSTSYKPNLITGSACYASSNVFCIDSFLHFIIAIGMLVGGLIITSQAGGAAGGIANTGMGAINKGKSFALRKTGAGAKKVGIGTAKFTGRKTLGVARGVDRASAGFVSGGRIQGGLVGTGLQRTANLATLKPLTRVIKKRREKVKDNYNMQRDIERINKMDEGEAKQQAYKSLRLTKDGVDMKYNSVTKMFEGVNRDGSRKTVKAPKMSQSRMRMIEGISMTDSTANAAANAAEDKKITEKADQLKQARRSPQELHRMLKDNSVSGDDKKAAALALGLESDHIGGMTQEQVRDVRKTLGSNKMLQDKFDDSMVKKYAHKIYNLDEQEGIRKYTKAVKGGKVDDKLDESALRDYRVHNLIREASPAKYERMMNLAKEDASTKEAATTGLKGAIEHMNFVVDENQIINPFRKQLAQITDNLGEALSDVSNPEDIRRGVNNMVQNMSATQMAKMDVGNFNDDLALDTFGQDETRRNAFRRSVDAAIEERIDQRELKQIQRAEGKNVIYMQARLNAKNNSNQDGQQNNSTQTSGPSREYTNQIGPDRDD